MILRKYFLLPGIFLFFFFSCFKVPGQRWPAGIHDPSKIVKCDDTYWVFGTGDGIYSIYSKDLITWHNGPTPFTKALFPAWIKNYVGAFEGNFWAPDIIYMNGHYYLYYSCSEWGTMTSTIGCVINKTLNPSDPEYQWKDAGFLGIWSYQPGLALNAIDPSLMRGPDGRIWMVYGSFNQQGIVVTEIDSVSGKPKTYAGNLPGISIANSWTGPQSSNYGEGEGASLIYRDGYYYLFYNKGGCCAGIASTYYMVMGRSSSPQGPFYDKDGVPLRRIQQRSGGTVVMKHDDVRGTDDRYYGPGHFGLYSEGGADYVTFHYYDPNGYYPNPAVNNRGGPTLGLARLVWGDDGWPSVSLDFVEEGVYTLQNFYSGKVADLYVHNPADGSPLYQYEADSAFFSQKWIFRSLGRGEYALRNYADPELVVAAGGTNNASTLSVTRNYTGAIHQRFRTLTSPNGKTIIYPSTKDAIWSLSPSSTGNVSVSLLANANRDHQKWKTVGFDEWLSVSDTKLTLEHTAGTDKTILVQSNGLWRSSVLYDTWLAAEASGAGNDTFTVTFSENPEVRERKSRIYLTTNGGKSLLISVTQTGKPSTSGSVENGDHLSIYPNPAGKELNIESPAGAVLSVYNLFGQKVTEADLETGLNTIDIINFEKGVYVFRIDSDGKILIQKVIKN